MAPASWTQRVGAALATIAVVLSLLSPPPSRAMPEATGDSPSQEIDTGESALVGPGSGATPRGAESMLVSLRVTEAHEVAESSTPGLQSGQASGEAPAVTRWRIAHGTSTSNP